MFSLSKIVLKLQTDLTSTHKQSNSPTPEDDLDGVVMRKSQSSKKTAEELQDEITGVSYCCFVS